MTVSKKMYTKKGTMLKIIWVASLIIIGIILSIFYKGSDYFLGFPSIGIFLIYIGIVGLVMTMILNRVNKEKIIDERAERIGYKASRITTLILIFTLFTVVIIDGIQPITIPYYLFASFLVCFYIICHLLSYKIIERKY